MKKSLTFKILMIYILVAAAGFFCFAVISYLINYKVLFDQTSDNLYREAINISNTYGVALFSDEKNERTTVLSELDNISSVNGSRTILIKADGNVLYDSNMDLTDDSSPLYRIAGFDSTRLGGEHVWMGDFYSVFEEKTMSVFTPVTSDFSTLGYVVLNVPDSSLRSAVMPFNLGPFIVYVSMAGLSLIFVIFYMNKIKKPLSRITTAINEYQKGNKKYGLQTDSSEEFRQLERSLEKMTDELNRSNASQQRFLSDISHDFRSPLTSIQGYLTAIKDGTIPADKLDRYIDILLFETNRLTGLTENILTLNELDPSAVILEKTDFDIINCIKHTIEAMLGQCERRGIRFNLGFFADKIIVHADEGKYQQVIYNLVDNAVKFSPDNSFIEINIKHGDNAKAVVSISDTGCGITKDELDKIWDRMYKTDASRNLNKKSSGLGLSITKDIITAHGEEISVESTPGSGTVFTFTAPLSET